MSNLLRKESGYYFRKVLPKDIQPIVSKREVRVSLRCHLKLEAKEKAAYLSLVVNKLVRQIRQNEANQDNETLRASFIHIVKNETNKIREPLVCEPSIPILNEAKSVEVEEPKVQKVQILKVDAKAKLEPVGKLKKLTVLLKEYKTHKVNTGEWKEGRVKEYRQAFELLLEVLPDKAVDLYTREEARHYRDTMLKLPTNRKKRKAYRDKTVKQLLNMDIPDKDVLAGKTINGQLSKISCFFGWVKDEYEDYLDTNVFEGLSVSEKDSISYKPFTQSELKQLFSSDAYLSFDRPSRYWLPLLGLYTSARIEELCQLKVTDVLVDDNGIRYFNLHDEGGNELKTESSYRKVPVHKTLIDMGFFEYYELLKLSGHTMLLPDLKRSDTNWSNGASKLFAKTAKEAGVKSDRTKCFHSFRKNTVDALALVTEKDSLVSQIVGHSQEGMTFGRYFSEYPLSLVKETIDLIEYDIPLEELKGLWRSSLS